MKTENRLRVGLVGCGHHGLALAQAMGRSDLLVLLACADPDPSATARVAALAERVSVFSSVEELLNATELDAIVVATPHHLLYECALAAIQTGKHVLVEKPIGMDEKEAEQLEEAAACAGVCAMAGYSFRFCPALQQVQALLQAGAVGEIQALMGSIGVGALDSGWIATPATGGGPLLFVGSHLVDELLWFVGDPPVEVMAKIRYRSDTRSDETSTFHLRFASGVCAAGLVTQAADGFFNNLDIIGHEGRISLRGVDYLTYTVEVVSKRLPAFAEPTLIRPRMGGEPKLTMLIAELAEFTAAIREQRQPSIPLSDGRRVLRVLDAVVKSDHCGERVRLA